MIAVRRSRTKGERHQKYGGQHHACHQQIGVLPAELVCHPCRHVVAELHDAEDVAVEHRHQQRPGMVVFKGILRRIRLIQKHVECLYAQQVRSYDKSGIQNQCHADESYQKTAHRQQRNALDNGTHSVEQCQQDVSSQVDVLHVACLQIRQHERKHHRHADACTQAKELEILGQHTHAARHFVYVAQVCSAREKQRNKQHQQHKHAERPGHPTVKRIICFHNHKAKEVRGLPSPHTSSRQPAVHYLHRKCPSVRYAPEHAAGFLQSFPPSCP